MRKIAFVALLAFLTSNASAYDSFKCTVKVVSELQDDGTQATGSTFMAAIGDEFVVDRRNGRMLGGLSNHGIGGQPDVIDKGSDVQSYKALTIFYPNVTVNYLQIKVWADSYEKPFFFVEGVSYITGSCEPY